MEIERAIEITNKYGLHARTSTKLAQTAQKFGSSIWVTRHTKAENGEVKISEEVDAKSVLGILSLGAECGDKICFRIEGDDAEAAIAELQDLVENRFHED